MTPWVRQQLFGSCLLFVLLAALPLTYSGASRSMNSPRGRRGAAYGLARRAIVHQLKTPTTPVFPYMWDPDVMVVRKGDVYVIRSYVDARNDSGGINRIRWAAEVQGASTRRLSLNGATLIL